MRADSTMFLLPHLFCSYIWGRGTMDLKFTVIALLEALNELLKSGW